MGLSCGIVGLPNVGKSTIFNALTNAQVMAENYPFCTVEPNSGSVPVPDQRLDALASIVRPQRIVPATMNFVDIAGLIRGASRGEGLGNQFLGHIRETDAIAHVVRCFESSDVSHVSGSVDPIRDIETIETELALADLDTAERAIRGLQGMAKTGNKAASGQCEVLEKVREGLDAGLAVKDLKCGEAELVTIRDCHFLTAKPVMYIANIGEEQASDVVAVDAVGQVADQCGSAVVKICGKIEAEIAELPASDRGEFIRIVGFDEPGLNRVVRAGYRLLGLHSFFTAVPKEVRAWTIPLGTCAQVAAGKVHTDFEEGFICAEVVSYSDLMSAGSESAAKSLGKWRLEGKDYELKDGDVVLFRFNV